MGLAPTFLGEYLNKYTRLPYFLLINLGGDHDSYDEISV